MFHEAGTFSYSTKKKKSSLVYFLAEQRVSVARPSVLSGVVGTSVALVQVYGEEFEAKTGQEEELSAASFVLLFKFHELCLHLCACDFGVLMHFFLDDYTGIKDTIIADCRKSEVWKVSVFYISST